MARIRLVLFVANCLPTCLSTVFVQFAHTMYQLKFANTGLPSLVCRVMTALATRKVWKMVYFFSDGPLDLTKQTGWKSNGTKISMKINSEIIDFITICYMLQLVRRFLKKDHQHFWGALVSTILTGENASKRNSFSYANGLMWTGQNKTKMLVWS